MAKPLKEQKVDKEKVWLIFILGAAGLFGTTLLLENNERFFPAIYKANLAMSQAKKAMKVSWTRNEQLLQLECVLSHKLPFQQCQAMRNGNHPILCHSPWEVIIG